MKKPIPSPREKSIQFEEGKSYRYKFRKNNTVVFHTECCACGLTHLEQYKLGVDTLTVSVWVEKEMTDKARIGKLRKLRHRFSSAKFEG